MTPVILSRTEEGGRDTVRLGDRYGISWGIGVRAVLVRLGTFLYNLGLSGGTSGEQMESSGR